MHRTLQVPLLLLLLLLIVVTSATDKVQVTSYRKPRRKPHGGGLCALDKANKTIASSSIRQCSLDCHHDASCTAFNIKSSTACDLYNYRPSVFAPVSQCENYQVNCSIISQCYYRYINTIVLSYVLIHVQWYRANAGLYKLEGAQTQRVHISAKWIFYSFYVGLGREMVPR